MCSSLRIIYLAHSIRSDWNNGNAHFLRGLLRALGKMGHVVTAYEPATGWSVDNLCVEAGGARSLQRFAELYPDLDIQTYKQHEHEDLWGLRLGGADIVIVHEWNPPYIAELLLKLRPCVGYKLLFHDTHHRASSSPEQIALFGLQQFDGILAFGNALREIYCVRFGLKKVWVLHEAADTSIFRPHPEVARTNEIVWIGNWGDEERSREISEFLINPAAALRDVIKTTVYGVRYPGYALERLTKAGIGYGAYLPNLDAPHVYARCGATIHVPRQQYSGAMKGIPTIRVFEALACGIPLVSAPWEDTEGLFRPDDFMWAYSSREMVEALLHLLRDPDAAVVQSARGHETVLKHHTCDQRAQTLSKICEEILQ